MKNIRLLIVSVVLACAGTVCLTNLTGCSAPPSSRVVQVQTLRAVGETAKTAMDATAQLLKQGSISLTQYIRVADLYDKDFQPAYRVAVAAARSDLSSVASPDLANLAGQIVNLVASYNVKPSTP